MKYQIEGTPFPVLICTLDAGETVVCETGAMLWMSSNMKMNTGSGGGIGKIFSRAVSGEALFQSSYTAEGGEGLIAFGVNNPGEIIPVEINANHSIIAQKGAFLASEETINSGITFQKKLGAGFFGGEGFILQKFTGKGYVFLTIDGGVINYDLEPGEQLIIDTGAFAFAEETIQVDVQVVKGLGNIIAGGEGIFNTTLVGPGKVWLQTMPMSTIVQAITKFLPK
ncbi:MAG: TIGR00266 family protein [Spirochaetaceae bacterium]|jgi:uncharacterized protein (TIGR00266 family)|nr:TIGR00266 family protein [Spirochaetaceae bacterium]